MTPRRSDCVYSLPSVQSRFYNWQARAEIGGIILLTWKTKNEGNLSLVLLIVVIRHIINYFSVIATFLSSGTRIRVEFRRFHSLKYLAIFRQLRYIISHIPTERVPAMKKEANTRQLADFFVASEQIDAAEARRLQRAARKNELVRIAPGLYVPQATPAEIEANVQRNWQKIAGTLVHGAVVSHISALAGGLSQNNDVILSHPTRFNTTINLPGVKLRLIRGPGKISLTPGAAAAGRAYEGFGVRGAASGT